MRRPPRRTSGRVTSVSRWTPFQRDKHASLQLRVWLRDDLEEVYALLLRFLGYGFRLAMSNVGWLVTQKFVILVPDPIGFAP